MGMMKQYAEEVSIEMGLGGELTEEALAEAQRRLDQRAKDEEYRTPMILLQRWAEPESGTVARLLDLPTADLEAVKADIAWLEAHAGDDYGGALSQWTLSSLPSRSIGKRVREQNKDRYTDLAAIRKTMVLESRYEEDPTFYGPEPYLPYAAIAGPGSWS